MIKIATLHRRDIQRFAKKVQDTECCLTVTNRTSRYLFSEEEFGTGYNLPNIVKISGIFDKNVASQRNFDDGIFGRNRGPPEPSLTRFFCVEILLLSC